MTKEENKKLDTTSNTINKEIDIYKTFDNISKDYNIDEHILILNKILGESIDFISSDSEKYFNAFYNINYGSIEEKKSFFKSLKSNKIFSKYKLYSYNDSSDNLCLLVEKSDNPIEHKMEMPIFNIIEKLKFMILSDNECSEEYNILFRNIKYKITNVKEDDVVKRRLDLYFENNDKNINNILNLLGFDEFDSIPKDDEYDNIDLGLTFDKRNLDFVKKTPLISNFIDSETFNLIYAPDKSMKSFLSYYIGLCVASGKNFLGMKTKQEKVLYIDWENSELVFTERLKGMVKGDEDLLKGFSNFNMLSKIPNLYNRTKYGKEINSKVLNKLIEAVEVHNYKFIIFDVFSQIGSDMDENAASEINYIKKQIFDQLTKRGATILVLHHAKKKLKKSDNTEIRGSSGIAGAVDKVYLLETESYVGYDPNAISYVEGFKFESKYEIKIIPTTSRRLETKELLVSLTINNEIDMDCNAEIKSIIFDSLEESKIQKDLSEKLEKLQNQFSQKLVEKFDGNQYTKKILDEFIKSERKVGQRQARYIRDELVEDGIISYIGNKYFQINCEIVNQFKGNINALGDLENE